MENEDGKKVDEIKAPVEPTDKEKVSAPVALVKTDFGLSRKDFHIEFTKEVDEQGYFEGYGSVFGNKDYQDDVVVAGAFADSIKRHTGSGPSVKMLWQHDFRQPVGVWPKLEEDKKGLVAGGKLFLDVQQGREAYVLMKGDAESGLKGLDGLSIGFQLLKHEMDDESHVRKLTKVDLWEISPVTFPANPRARVRRVKDIETIRDFEQFLRDAGYSSREAKAIASNGYRSLTERDVQVQDLDAVAAALGRVHKLLKGESDGAR